MTHTPHTQPPDPTRGEMLEEVIDLSTGLGVALLPLLVLAVPGLVLFVLLPALLMLALAAPLAVIAVPAYLVACWLRRRGSRVFAWFRFVRSTQQTAGP